MARDESWDLLKEAMMQRRKNWQENNMRHANNVDDGGWTKHTAYHWSRQVDGHRLDYWPSTKKYQFRGKVRSGSPRKLLSSPQEGVPQ